MLRQQLKTPPLNVELSRRDRLRCRGLGRQAPPPHQNTDFIGPRCVLFRIKIQFASVVSLVFLPFSHSRQERVWAFSSRRYFVPDPFDSGSFVVEETEEEIKWHQKVRIVLD